MSTFTNYLTIANNLSRYQTMTAADPTVAQASKYFQDNIAQIKTIDQFVNNKRIFTYAMTAFFTYAMTAFGLSDMTYAKSLIKKLLEQGATRSGALANTLNNPKILALAKAFNFQLYGADTTQTIAATSDVVNKYVMQRLKANAGNKNAGVQLALYFQQNASKITSGYSILADPNLLKVVQTTLGLSSYTSVENVDRQAAQFDKLLKYSDFQDPAKVRSFLERFTAQYDVANPGVSASPLVSALGSGSSASVGFSVDLLMSLQNLKLGG